MQTLLLLAFAAHAADDPLLADLSAELASAGVPCSFASFQPPTLVCAGWPEQVALGLVHDLCPLLAEADLTALRLDVGQGPRACTTAPECRCEGETDGDLAYWAVEDAVLAETEQAAALYAAGDLRGGLEHSRRALALLEEAGVPDTHPMMVPRVYEIAWVTGQQGDHAAAAALYDRVLWALVDDALFEPAVRGPMLNNVGLTLHHAGRSDEGVALIRQALAVLPATHPDRAVSQANLATLLVERGEFAEAEALLSEAIPKLQRPDALGRALVALGKTHLAFARPDEAETAYRRAIEVLAPARAYPEWPVALLGMARVLTVRGRGEEALAVLEEARKVCAERGDVVLAARIDRSIADLLEPRDAGAAEARLRAAEAALKALDPAHGELVDLWLAWGWFELRRERGDAARTRFGDAVALAEASHPARRVAALRDAAVFHLQSAEPAKALELARRALPLAEGADRTGVLALVGLLELEVNGPKAAKAIVEEAAAASEGLPAEDRVVALQSLVTLRKLEGDLDGAVALLEEMVALREATLGREDPLTLAALADLGAVYGEQGRHELALDVLEEALAGAERRFGADDLALVKPLQNLAVTYGELGQMERAEPLLRRALAIAEAHGAVALAAAVRANLGAHHVARGQAEPAIALYEQSLAELGESVGERHRTYVDALVRLSRAEMLAGRDDAAFAHLKEAARLVEDGADVAPRDSLALLYSLGLLCERIGDATCAAQTFAMAVEGGGRALGPDHPDVLFSEVHLGYVLLRAGRADEALPHVRHVLETQQRQLGHVLVVGDDAQRRGFVRVLQSQLDLLVSLHVDGGPAAEAVGSLVADAVLARKGIVLDAEIDRLSLRQRHASPEQEALLDALRTDTRLLATLVLRGAEADPAFHAEQVAALEARIAGIEDRLGAGETELPHVDVGAVAAALPPDSVLVEILRYQRVTWPHTPARAHYAAYVVRPDGSFTVVDLGPADAIDEAATDLVDGLRTCTGGCRGVRAVAAAPVADLPTRSRALHDRAFAPLLPALGDARRVLLAPDGGLSLVPFDALTDGAGEPLIREWSFSYLGAGRDLLRERSSGEAGPALVIAAPDYGASASLAPAAEVLAGSRAGDVAAIEWPPLPGTAAEARQVGKLVAKPRATLVGAEATETALKAATSPRVLHVATHGFFLPDAGSDPMLRSGLALRGANGLAGDGANDGVLTARELAMEVDLRQTQLVVLSACETGVGEVHGGQGVYGLRRALVLAGADAQVMSLWQVDDTGTQELMVRFYRYLRRGRAPAEALRAAQLELLDSGTWAHPYYWAAFVASG